MRLALLALVLGLAACAQRGVSPSQIRLDYSGQGTLDLNVSYSTAWKLIPGSPWLTTTPAEGLGPARVSLQAKPTELPEAPSISTDLQFSGDLQGSTKVTLPLVKLSGQVQAPPSQTSFSLEAGAVPLRGKPQNLSTGEILVKYRSSGLEGSRTALHEPVEIVPQGAALLSSDRLNRLVKLRTSDLQTALRRLQSDPRVEWAEPNGIVWALGEPADEFYPLEWHLRLTGARFSYLGSYPNPVTVAVVDTGVRYDHPDLQGRLVLPGEGALDLVEGDSDPTDTGDIASPDKGSHGTHVTGIITAGAGTFVAPCPNCSNSGVVGVAWPAPVKVLPIRILDESGNGTFEAVAAAIRYAAGIPVEFDGKKYVNPQPASVINLSLGSTTQSQAMCEAVAEATARGVAVVAAAGNGGGTAYYYPASCPGAISVGATDYNFGGLPRPAWYSQRNDRVSVAAPGGDTAQFTGGLLCRNKQTEDERPCPDGILSTTWNFNTNQPNYAFYMGTSQAAPQVAAALALLISSGQASDGQAAWEQLKSHLTDLGPAGKDDAYGLGFLNLPGALGLKLPPGPYVLALEGPTPRLLRPDASGYFETYVMAGDYELRSCRDDSQNGLCDASEPRTVRQLQVPSQAEFSMGLQRVPTP
ncbi:MULTISPECIES: S8 family serine peptidase [unclassified Meiothermus]|uniref:S8 family serine peptidase n=1 Tax=unclassified Meiothermus TaxID=370471 RepID=UPI000D7CEFF4|nr:MULTISPECIES: S8 family serine peptidase [unclassified Meiothermus]PZA06991.1 peptidase S8 [Meiothermus sp. Pnk-1]RYM35307.1 peptidase S8 [Meiothermus sp. PNK-Is4]